MERIAVVGLGYVGLPVAVAFARKFEHVVGFDINEGRIAQLLSGSDLTNEVPPDELAASTCRFTADPDALKECTFFVVAVPTPIDVQKRPDLRMLEAASRTAGRAISKGAVVVFESTVYPGVTEEICGPILEQESGLVCGVDFHLGYSPERINPGDTVHRLETIVKVVSGQDEATLERVATTYERIVDAGVHRAPTIRVAEAAKVIENTQRDLNIALMNELALIFSRLGIRTTDVLAAAGTKWNFLRFHPGLVGGHCIGVDPYYLTAKAEAEGYHPEVILAGRRVNDQMGAFIARQVVKHLNRQGQSASGARIGVLGLTFKEDVPDIRNSKVPDIIAELLDFGTEVLAHDPLADVDEVERHLKVECTPLEDFGQLDGVILAVKHREYLSQLPELLALVRPGGVVYDVKSVMDPDQVRSDLTYLSL